MYLYYLYYVYEERTGDLGTVFAGTWGLPRNPWVRKGRSNPQLREKQLRRRLGTLGSPMRWRGAVMTIRKTGPPTALSAYS